MLFQKSLVFLGSKSFICCMKDSKNHIFNLFFSLLNFLLQLQKVNQRALLFGSLVNLFPRERNSFLSNRQSLDIHTFLGPDFLAHLSKGNVTFCHHLASVVRRPLTFHILIFSSQTSQPKEVKLGRKHLWKVLSKVAHFVPLR